MNKFNNLNQIMNQKQLDYLKNLILHKEAVLWSLEMDTDEGLVNGAQGTVENIKWGAAMPTGIYVKFDSTIDRSLRCPPS